MTVNQNISAGRDISVGGNLSVENNFAQARSAIKTSSITDSGILKSFEEVVACLERSSVKEAPESLAVSDAIHEMAKAPTNGRVERLKAALGKLRDTAGISAELAAKLDSLAHLIKGWVGA